MRSYGYYALAIKQDIADVIHSDDKIFYESCNSGCDSTNAFTFLKLLPYTGEGFYTRWIYLVDLVVCIGMDNCYNNFTYVDNTPDLQKTYYLG